MNSYSWDNIDLWKATSFVKETISVWLWQKFFNFSTSRSILTIMGHAYTIRFFVVVHRTRLIKHHSHSRPHCTSLWILQRLRIGLHHIHVIIILLSLQTFSWEFSSTTNNCQYRSDLTEDKMPHCTSYIYRRYQVLTIILTTALWILKTKF